MALNTLADLSTTAASNTDFRGQSIQGSASVSTIDSMLQNLAAMLARFYDDIGATGTVAGTGDAITLTSGSAFGSLANGNVVSFKAGASNTGAATINVDALGAKAVRRQGDTDLSANDIVASGIYLLRYDTAYNSGAGAWVLLNPSATTLSAATTTEQLTGTDASKYATPDSISALWEKGADVAASSIISLGEGGYFHITGTTAITDIDFATPKDGRMAMLVFDGSLTLTHNATTLVLPSGANITTMAGDTAIIVQDSGDNIKVIAYQRASGASVASSDSITLLGTLTTTSGTTQTLSGLTLTSYKFLKCMFNGVSGSANAAEFKLGGVTVVTTASSGNRVYGYVEFDLANGVGHASLSLSDGGATAPVGFTSTVTTATTSLAIYNSNGNFDAGSVRVYGVR